MKNLLAFSLLFASAQLFSQTNNALTLNGNFEYVELGTPIPNGSSYTKEAWINPSLLSGANNIISSYNAPFWISNGRLAAGHAGNYSVVIDDFNIPANTWTHVAVTYDAVSDIMALYKNGVQIKTATFTSSYTIEQTYIGTHWGNESFFNGKLDEIRIWNRSLSAQEIKGQMLKSPAVNSTGLVQYFKCNQTFTGLLNNSVNNGMHGSCTDGSFIASPVQYSVNSMNFDGTNDFIVVPASSNFNLAAATVEFLIKPTVAVNTNSLIAGSRTGSQTRFSIHVNTSNNTIGLWNGSAFGTVPYNFVIGEWVQIAVTIGASSSNVYVNGQYQGVINYGMGTATNLPFIIGAAETYEYFTGMIDEVRVWNYHRTQAQIQQFKSSELDPANSADVSGLVAYYTFNQGIPEGNNQAFTNVYDQVGTNHGQINGLSLNGGTSNYVVQNSMLSALALVPNSFNIQKSGNSVLLTWKVSKKSSNHYTVQRSTDGRNWITIATVNNHSAISDLSYTDRNPLTGKNYYRVSETDVDGKITFSDVKFINFDSEFESFQVISTQPGMIRIKISKPSTIRLFSSTGRLISSKFFEKGEQLFNYGNISSGIYILKSEDHTEKVLIK
jgi:hypothetical protein